jgi:hypothetical protein
MHAASAVSAMKLTLKIFTDADGYVLHALGVDGKSYIEVAPLTDCPEDAIIGRALVDGKQLIAAIRMGYEAGLREEHFGVEEIEVDHIDSLEFDS